MRSSAPLPADAPEGTKKAIELSVTEAAWFSRKPFSVWLGCKMHELGLFHDPTYGSNSISDKIAWLESLRAVVDRLLPVLHDLDAHRVTVEEDMLYWLRDATEALEQSEQYNEYDGEQDVAHDLYGATVLRTVLTRAEAATR